jgi:hypothetical protein
MRQGKLLRLASLKCAATSMTTSNTTSSFERYKNVRPNEPAFGGAARAFRWRNKSNTHAFSSGEAASRTDGSRAWGMGHGAWGLGPPIHVYESANKGPSLLYTCGMCRPPGRAA